MMMIPLVLYVHQIGTLSLFLIISVLRCKGEPPSNSYGPPSRGGSQPAPVYGVPPSGQQSKSNGSPGPNYGPPPSSHIKPPSPGGKHASPSAGGSGSESGNEEANPKPFSFMYEVKDAATNNDYSHKQESDGKTVKGEYKVLLPDGRNQVVTYTADDGGFNADVKYDGEAQPSPELGGGGGGGIGPTAGHGGGPGRASGGYPSASLNKGGAGGASGYPPAGPPVGGSFDGYSPAGPPAGGASPNSSPGGGPPQNSYLPPPSFGGY